MVNRIYTGSQCFGFLCCGDTKRSFYKLKVLQSCVIVFKAVTALPAGVAVLSFYCIIVILMPHVLMHYLFGPERFYSDKPLTKIA